MEEQEPNVGWNEALGEHAGNPATPRTTGDVITVYWPCALCAGKGKDPSNRANACSSCRGTGHNGEVRAEYVLPSCENRIKAQFEQWLNRNAKRAIQQAEVEDGPEEAARLRSAYVADYAAGLYTWDGRHGRSARGDLPGIRHLLFLLLRRAYPDTTEQQAQALWKADPQACSTAMAWSVGNAESPAGEEPLPGETRKNGSQGPSRKEPARKRPQTTDG